MRAEPDPVTTWSAHEETTCFASTGTIVGVADSGASRSGPQAFGKSPQEHHEQVKKDKLSFSVSIRQPPNADQQSGSH